MEIRDAKPLEQSELTALHRRSSYLWEEDRIHLDSLRSCLITSRRRA